MSEPRPASEILDGLKPPPPGNASDVLDTDRMIREGQDQARRQQEMVNDLNGKPRGSR